jgi:hypothetical protein
MKLLGLLQPLPGYTTGPGAAGFPTRATLASPGLPRRRRASGPRRDSTPPVIYQIAVLASLLVYGMAWLGLDIQPGRAVAILAAALLTQLAATAVAELPRFDPKSALISGLSLCLLLRTNDPWLAMLAAVVAVASKFLLRVRGKHLFNPTNFALVAMMLVTGQVWASPGQWGSAAVFAFLLASAGGLVVNRAARADVTWTFLASYAALWLGRSIWLGDPPVIPLHRLENGALVLFAFFMISDPRTTPDSRAGRMLFAVLSRPVPRRAVQALPHQWPAGVACAPSPSPDRPAPPRPALPVAPGRGRRGCPGDNHAMKIVIAAAVAASLAVSWVAPALAFCGFYVAKADAKLFNRASQVVLARHDDKTVLTMANDYKGELREFAIVLPVPTVLERGQIRVGDRALVEHLDAYSAPRLVEYFDPDPCTPRPAPMLMMPSARGTAELSSESADRRAKSLGVTIEAQYTVGEYDILILSARESGGLETWLRDNGYRVPAGATAVLGSYLKQGMRFFVAKVNLTEQAKLGFSYLRPLQMAFDTPKFMLPIRLGTLNADGAQELFVYALTRKGRVETTNYRTVRLPTGVSPLARQATSARSLYRAMFGEQVKKSHARRVPRYAWDMGWCDPCAANPLSAEGCVSSACSGLGRGPGCATPQARAWPGRSRRVRDAASRPLRRRALPR